MKKISIIIPNYNNAKWLKASIKSCLEQEGNFEKEIIIVDDHSSDASWELLEDLQKKYPSEIFLYKNPSKGGNSARNYGFSKSSGDYIQWLDADDSLLKGKLKAQVEVLNKESAVDIVYSDWQMDYYQDEQFLRSEVRQNQAGIDFLEALLMNQWQANSAYLMRRSIAKQLFDMGLWSTETKIGQDREYFTQAGILGARFKYVPGCFAVYNRWSESTVSTKMSFKDQHKHTLSLNQKFYDSFQSSEITDKKRYISILNAELLNALFYFPMINIPRTFLPWQLRITHWHWKKKLFFPLLYLWHLFRKA